MWVFLNDAFLSIVTPRRADIPKPLRDRDVLLVRARRGGDLQRVFRKVRVSRTPERDYAFRAFVPRRRVMQVLGERLFDLDYTNFKDSVREDSRHDAYLKVWTAMYQYQQGSSPRWRNVLDHLDDPVADEPEDRWAQRTRTHQRLLWPDDHEDRS